MAAIESTKPHPAFTRRMAMLIRITLALIFAFAVIAAAPAFAKSKADECRPWDGDYHWIC